jgi:hypothetical protein
MKTPLLIDEADLKCFREVFQIVIKLPPSDDAGARPSF